MSWNLENMHSDCVWLVLVIDLAYKNDKENCNLTGIFMGLIGI